MQQSQIFNNFTTYLDKFNTQTLVLRPQQRKRKMAKSKPEIVKKKKKAVDVETPVKKKKSKDTVAEPVKKKKAVELETPVKKKSKEVVAEPEKKKKKSKLPVITEVMSPAQLVIEVAERSDIDNKTAKTVLTAVQSILVESLRKGGVGTLKAFGWNFKSTLKPATKGGEKRANPFRKGEFLITKPKPETMKIKALALKPFKNQLDGI